LGAAACSSAPRGPGATARPLTAELPAVARATPHAAPSIGSASGALVTGPAMATSPVTATTSGARATPATPGTTAVAAPADVRGTVFALLTNNHLVAIRARDGAVLADRPLAPAPAATRGAGQFLALSADGGRLFALGPGAPDQVVAVDVATIAVRATYPLAADGGLFRSL